LVTPELSRCGVAGVTRERIMKAAAREGTGCREESISQARLFDAQEAMLVNSLIGVWQIGACAGKRWAVGTYTARVRKWLDEEMG
jgi:4-amino-4-deoxychorismate lyase